MWPGPWADQHVRIRDVQVESAGRKAREAHHFVCQSLPSWDRGRRTATADGQGELSGRQTRVPEGWSSVGDRRVRRTGVYHHAEGRQQGWCAGEKAVAGPESRGVVCSQRADDQQNMSYCYAEQQERDRCEEQRARAYRCAEERLQGGSKEGKACAGPESRGIIYGQDEEEVYFTAGSSASPHCQGGNVPGVREGGFVDRSPGHVCGHGSLGPGTRDPFLYRLAELWLELVTVLQQEAATYWRLRCSHRRGCVLPASMYVSAL